MSNLNVRDQNFEDNWFVFSYPQNWQRSINSTLRMFVFRAMYTYKYTTTNCTDSFSFSFGVYSPLKLAYEPISLSRIYLFLSLPPPYHATHTPFLLTLLAHTPLHFCVLVYIMYTRIKYVLYWTLQTHNNQLSIVYIPRTTATKDRRTFLKINTAAGVKIIFCESVWFDKISIHPLKLLIEDFSKLRNIVYI